jgi:hypothetical protein
MDIKPGPDKSYLQIAIAENRPKIFSISPVESATKFPRILTQCDITTAVALPLTGVSGSKGVATFGFKSTKHIGRAQLEMLSAGRDSFNNIHNEIVLLEQSATLAERENLLKEYVLELNEETSCEALFASTARAVALATNAPIIRLSTLDAGRKFLTSRVLINESISKVRTPQNAHLILSLLRWHNTAAQNGNTVMVDCSSGRGGMMDIETMQVFAAGLKRAVIVPLKSQGKVVGLLSLGDDKAVESQTLSESNIHFVESLAALAGSAIESRLRDKTAMSDFAQAAKDEIVTSSRNRGMRSQLRSSLTSILGSLEMIRTGDKQDEGQRDKFLKIIDRSARKLSEYLPE